MHLKLLAPLLLLPFAYSLVPAQSFTSVPFSLPPADGRSVNLIDIDGDGNVDLFVSNGPKGGQNNTLLLNDGKGHLVPVAHDPIAQDGAPSDGAAFADVDNDGDLDAVIVTWYGAPNQLYLNTGDGQFQLDTVSPIGWQGTFSETAAWGDYDNDGLLDLYITNSTDFKTNTPALQRNLLFRNAGKGRFRQVFTDDWLKDAHISRATHWVDYDGDKDLDLFVSNEENQPNTLYRNDRGNFRPVNNTLTSDSLASTGASWGDVDNDGDLDLFVANFLNQNNQLFLNDGKGNFSGAAPGDLSGDGGCSFGSSFADADNDGDLDLFVTNGFCQGELSNFYYQNDGSGRFTRDTSTFPSLSTACSFGVAWGDLNNDGFIDLAIANCRNRSEDSFPSPTLFFNRPNGNHWLKIRLTGTKSNRSAVGAKVFLRAKINGKPISQMRTIATQSGYCGQNPLEAHFGLGNASTVEELQIEWPSGEKTKLRDVPSDQVVRITEPGTPALKER